ncbi:MAG TPA: sigma-70 family RNA polymerase sigma factor [Candidatus Limnocylindria bacterium]|nr:sigma-70 family RNA polymerase sigma factor [Candidatus Limnocylindria bacterium]
MRTVGDSSSMTAPMAIEYAPRLASIVGDEGRFRAWYDAVMPRVYRYLAARCGGDDALAEELTQQTFVEAIRSRDRFDGRSDVVSWLCAIGRHKLVDHYRRIQRDDRRQDRLIDHQRLGADTPWRAVEARDAVNGALAQLPPDQRLALLFRHLDGMPVREVAAAIGRSEKATESLLARARESFRRAYGDRTHA